MTAVDGPDTLNLTFFNSRYAVEALQEGTEYIFYGKAEGTLLRREMNTPTIYPTDSAALVPVYALTAGLTSRSIGKNIAAALESLAAVIGRPPKTTPEALARHLKISLARPLKVWEELSEAVAELDG